jgi:hypothetical protein
MATPLYLQCREWLRQFRELAQTANTELELKDILQSWATLGELDKELRELRDQLATRAGDMMPEKTASVFGATVEKHRRTVRRSWAVDELLRVVLDSRLVDQTTGEIKEETPLEKVLHVWRLPAPRLTALRERQIDFDQFVETERRPGWELRLHQGGNNGNDVC